MPDAWRSGGRASGDHRLRIGRSRLSRSADRRHPRPAAGERRHRQPGAPGRRRAHPSGNHDPGSADELWAAAAGLDLVVIATPTASHNPLATEAIDRGIPVAVDKPIAVSATGAEALVDRARDAGAPLTVFQNRRWDSDHLTLARLVADGRFGDVIRYASRFERWRPNPTGAWRKTTPPERGGGQLLDPGSHLVDQALVLFGPVTEVCAEVEARRGLSGDDDAFPALKARSATCMPRP